MRFDPIDDERKLMTVEEFEKELRLAVEEYRKTFEGVNEFHRHPHTWQDWMASFQRWMSW